MANVSQYRLANQAANGRLGDLLIRWRDAGDSYRTVAHRLGDLFGIVTTPTTVRRWTELAKDDPEVRA